MMYESAVQPITVLSQTTQCLTVFLLRCGEFRRLRTKRYLAANWCQSSAPATSPVTSTYMGVHDGGGAKTGDRKAVAHTLKQRACAAQSWRRNVLSNEVVYNGSDDLGSGWNQII